MTWETVVGRLRLESGDGLEGSVDEYYFGEGAKWGGDGVWLLPVRFASPEQADATPLNEDIALVVSFEASAAEAHAELVVYPGEPWFHPVDGSSAPALRDDRVINIGIFYLAAPDTDQEYRDRQQARADKMAAGVQADLRDVVGRKWWVEARGYVLETFQLPGKGEYLEDVISEWEREQQTDGFQITDYHVRGGYHNSYCGWGSVGRHRSMTYAVQSCGLKQVKHEIYHGLGLRHSTSRVGSGVDEYGDRTCVMGRGETGLNPAQRVRLGLEDEREIIRVGRTMSVALTPADVHPAALFPDQYQIAEIDVVGSDLMYLGKRKYSGSNVFVHTLGSDRKTVKERVLSPGEEWNGDGVTLHYLGEDGDQSAIDVIMMDEGVTQPVLPVSEAWPAALPGTFVDYVHTGLWYNPKMPGQGLDVSFLPNGHVVVMWYTYNLDGIDGRNPARRFFIGAGHPEDFPIFTTEGGSFGAPSSRTERLVGRGRLFFYDEQVGMFLFNLDTADLEAHTPEGYGRGAMPLTRLMWSGLGSIHFQPDRAGEGFSVQQTDDGQLSCFWYTYGPAEHTRWGQPRDGTRQRWYQGLGEMVGDTAQLALSEVTGGRFMHHDPVQESPAGTAELYFGVDETVFTYTADFGEGELTLEQIE